MIKCKKCGKEFYGNICLSCGYTILDKSTDSVNSSSSTASSIPIVPPITTTPQPIQYVTQYPCLLCNQPMIYVKEYVQWYCERCRKYASEMPNYPCPQCSRPLRFIPAYQRWYCDSCIIYI